MKITLSSIFDIAPVSINSMQIFRSSPPLASEIDNVIERVTGTLMRQEGLLFTIHPNQLEIVSNRVYALLINPGQLQAILDALGRHDTLELLNTPPNTLTWSCLKEKYPCAMCGDVLAAPSICPCLHSFCGLCLLEKSLASPHLKCPECEESIGKCNIYERNLADQIEGMVNITEDCQEKTQWRTRNEKYKEHRRQEESIAINQMTESSFCFEDFARQNLIPIAVFWLFAVDVIRRL